MKSKRKVQNLKHWVSNPGPWQTFFFLEIAHGCKKTCFLWFQALLVFLRMVVSHQDQNRMSLWNVSMVMAPNLFRRHHGNKRSIAKRDEMEEAVGGAQLIRLMIIHQDLIWTVGFRTHLHSLGAPNPRWLLVLFDRSPSFYCLRWDRWTRCPFRNSLAWAGPVDFWGRRMTRMKEIRWDRDQGQGRQRLGPGKTKNCMRWAPKQGETENR